MTTAALAELDLAVAMVEGRDCFILNGTLCMRNGGTPHADSYQPTRDGAEAMRLLEKYELDVFKRVKDSYWTACDRLSGSYLIGLGETPAIAICRAVVAINRSRAPNGDPDTIVPAPAPHKTRPA